MKAFLDVDGPPPARDWSAMPLPPQQRLGHELKCMFDTLTAGPLPERLIQLADALEDAFRRGELFDDRRGELNS